MRVLAAVLSALSLVVGAETASASKSSSASWAAPQIAAVVASGLMGPSTAGFRANEPLTRAELETIVTGLGGWSVDGDPYATVSVKEFDAQLLTVVGLRDAARDLRLRVLESGIAAPQWLGTETVARLLGLRINHPRSDEQLELQVTQPVTRAEAAFSVARVLALTTTDLATVRVNVDRFTLPLLDDWQRLVVERALRFVGSPYVWAGTSERPQRLGGVLYPGGFDCSGLVWRVYKLQPFAGAPGLAQVLKGRTTYAMSAEVAPAARIPRAQLQPGDVVFFGSRGRSSKPAEVGHMGIYVGNGWMVHSSSFGTTLTPMTGWYEKTFAWARRPLAEAGLTPLQLQGLPIGAGQTASRTS